MLFATVPADAVDLRVELAPLAAAPAIAPAARLRVRLVLRRLLLLAVARCVGFPLSSGAGVAASALAESWLPLIKADTSAPAAAFAKASVSCRTTFRMHSTVTLLGKSSPKKLVRWRGTA